MKLQGKQVGFRVTLPWFGRRRLILHGTRNSVQLLETAMVIEGYLQRFFFFPIIDRFFRMPFSEWTTVTVPYSRVLRVHYARMLTQRVVVTAVPWLLVAVMAFGSLSARQIDWAGVGIVLLPAVFLAVVVTLYANLALYAPRYYLWFRHADGKRGLVAFRIPSKKRRLEFADQLREYRKATRAKGVAMQELSEAELAAPSPGIWVVLVLFVLMHRVLMPVTGWDPGAPRAAPPPPPVVTNPGGMPPRPQPQAQQPPSPVPVWAWQALHLAVSALPLLLVSLALVARRNEGVRWAAVLSLAALALAPPLRLFLLAEQPGGGASLDAELPGALLHAGYHVFLTALLLWVTAPEPKDDL